jgi:MFS transporter, OFA family, oxalate/formate antiporter
MATVKERNRITVLVACLIVMTTAGILNSTSVFVSPLAGYFGWSTDAIANVSTLMLLCWTPGCLLGGSIMNKIGARSSILLGGILFSLGLLCTSFVPKSLPVVLYLTFSFMQGVGNGITYTVATYVATGWFPDRRGLAAGLCMACNGGASAFLAPICARLTLATSIITTLRTVGIAAMAVVIICSAFIAAAPAGYMPKGFDKKRAGAEAKLESYNVRRAVRTRPLWHLIVCTAFFPTMYMIMFPRFSVLMQDAGFSLSAATLGVSIYFIANTLGRLLLGALCDRVSYKHVYGICGVFCILSAVFLIFAGSVPMFYIGYICLGIGFGATNSVYPVAINKSYGPVYAGGIYGISLFGYMLYCTLITPRISTALVSATGDYTASFIYAGALTCIAVLSMYLIPGVERKNIALTEEITKET